MKKVELLAPAGNIDCLKAAIAAGCDAVYLGGKLYGARGFAGNFTNDELIEAINYAHLYGVKVYLTVNTIIYEREVDKFLNYIRFAHKNNIDAVILQDIGMFDLLRKKFPNLELHASTQMHIHNYEGALLAKKLGFKRIVMARETPIKVIENIKKEIDIEVEVFIHGALCISYSGQCLASALIGNRSGNRGTCAQICRKKYDLYDENKNKLNDNNYLLSTKDLCTLEHIDKTIESGVDSLKIEGRMKRPEYVYLVTKIYRKAIDSYYETGKINISKEDMLSLGKIFNRCFTKGFMLSEENNNYTYEVRPNHKGIKVGTVVSKIKNNLKIKLSHDINLHDGLRIIDDKEDKGLIINKMFINGKPKEKANKGDTILIKYDKFVKVGSDVILTTDHKQIKEINEVLKENTRKVLVDIYVEAFEDKELLIKVRDDKNEVIIRSDKKIEKAISNPITKEKIIKQLSKTGDTVYKVCTIDVNMDDDIFINIKDINELRRKVLRTLDDKRLYQIPFVEKEYFIDVNDFDVETKSLALIKNKEKYLSIKDKYDEVYSEEKIDEGILKLPRVINKYEDINDRVLIGEFGSLLKYENFDTDFSFNVVNSYSLVFLHSMGARYVTLSYELNLTQIENIIKAYEERYKKHPNIMVIINSYPEAMISKFDLNRKYNIKKGYLRDEYDNFYTIESNDSYMKIYHFEKVNLYNKEELYKIGVNAVRTNF